MTIDHLALLKITSVFHHHHFTVSALGRSTVIKIDALCGALLSQTESSEFTLDRNCSDITFTPRYVIWVITMVQYV